MLCKIRFSSENNIVMPFSYNNIIQAVLYKFINEESFSAFMHNEGYVHNNRSYKLFSFSNIIGKPIQIDKVKKEFMFDKEISLYVSSVDNEFFQYVFNAIIGAGSNVRLGNNKVIISNIELIQQEISEQSIVRALSPITVYSTLTTYDNKKKTYYYNPFESDFGRIIQKNLMNKYESLYGKQATNCDFTIRHKGEPKEKIVKYKNFIIKGYDGIFEISGSKELMEIAFCAGLGSKNSQGFGLIVRNDMEAY